METPEVKSDHNHDSDMVSIEVTKMRMKMSDQAKTATSRPKQILASALSTVENDVRAAAGRQDTIKRTIRRHQRGKLPKDPPTLKELKIEDEWTQTAGPSPKNFLIHDSGSDASQRIIIFGTDEALRHLALTSTWFMDGCFSMAPRLFQQLYIIRAPLGESAVTCVYALLPGKSQNIYEGFLRAVVERCEELGYSPDPSKVHVDFEKSMMNAVHAVLGSHVNIGGCFYHLTQSSFRKVQELGLVEQYRADKEFKHFCDMMDGLGFLPVDEVENSMSFLRQNCYPGAEELLDYFDATYVSGTFRKILRPTTDDQHPAMLRIRRISPLFPPKIWNVFETTLHDGDRTNNYCEGWNNSFRSMVGHNHPSIWRLIRHLQEDAVLVITLLLQEARGQLPPKRQSRAAVALQKKLKNLCQAFQDGSKTLEDFLDGIGHCVRLL